MTYKNFCFKTSWDTVMADNVNGLTTGRCTVWVRYGTVW